MIECRLLRWLWQRRVAVAVMIGLGWFPLGNSAAAEDERIDFNRDVRPILSDKCFACHGFDPNHREADLRLDQAPTAEEIDSWVIVPGDLESSLFWERITSDDEGGRMPPPETHKSLSAAELDILRQWIVQGANYQPHWSFQAIPKSVEVPPIPSSDHPIDAFIHHRLQAEGLSPSPPTDRTSLLRRVSFALTGLPPTIDQVKAFAEDQSSDSYRRVVDQLLASPHYGEEMARHWLDVARYADTHGMHLDNERQMWAYRDWVIAAFNQNQRFDQFTVDQLAGDLLPEPSQQQLVATGFNRCNVTSSEGGSIDDELLFRYAVDRASTMAETWLGLTAGCAACHDHKFDPISQKEFYSLYAFFYSAADPAMDGNALLTAPTLRLESESDRQQIAELRHAIQSANQQLQTASQSLDYQDPATLSPRPDPIEFQQWWLDDAFLDSGKVQASPGHATEFVTATLSGVTPFQGMKALKRTATGLAQDVWETTGTKLDLPPQATFVAHVFLEPESMPHAIMVQFNHGGWKHRAVWGDYEIIHWGTPGTNERVAMGELPDSGRWVRLEFPLSAVGLNPGDEISGFALTQHGGTVYWDQVGVVGQVNPATDPGHSFLAWWQQVSESDIKALPAELQPIARQAPSTETAAEASPSVAAEEEDEEVVEQANDQANNQANDQAVAKLRQHYLIHHCSAVTAQLAPVKQQLAAAETKLAEFESRLPSTFIFRDLPQPRQAHLMIRGQYDQPGEAVEPNVPQVLPALHIPSDKTSATRLELAQWIVAPDNPLTARVIVNRLWQQFFANGLVSTSADFGSQGDSPSHPELLDWLAREFQSSGWDIQHIVRLIVTSQTFQQSAVVSAELLERDPKNVLLARMPRLRLDAEQIRDNALFVSGLLVTDMGGKGVKPYQPPNIWEPVGFAGSNTRFYTQDAGSALYRRSIYTFLKRTAPPPFMSNFDAPNREQICTGRQRSNTPLQALQLMNDVQFVEAARNLAIRLLQADVTDDRQRIELGFQTVLGRLPSNFETEILIAQLETHVKRYQSETEQAGQLISQGESPVPEGIDPVRMASFTMVVNTLLNLDETITRN